jgi:hypothetical protein
MLLKQAEKLQSNNKERKMEKKIMGLSVEILKPNPTYKGIISSEHSRAIIIGEGIPEIFEPSDGEIVLKIVRRIICGREHVHAEPLNTGSWAAGGNFVWTCDSRFPNQYPVQIHDYNLNNESKY